MAEREVSRDDPADPSPPADSGEAGLTGQEGVAPDPTIAAQPAPEAATPPTQPAATTAREALTEALDKAQGIDPAEGEPKGAKVKDLTPIARAGVELARRVLLILAVLAGSIVVMIAWQEFIVYPQYLAASYDGMRIATKAVAAGGDAKQSEAAVAQARALIATVAAQQKETRDFLLQLAQLVLLTLFLPVLTALLGYIFGTRQDTDRSDAK
jgi:hypothetical protein